MQKTKLIHRPTEVFLLMLTSTLLGCDVSFLVGIHYYHIIKDTVDIDFVTIFVPIIIILIWILHFLIRSIKQNEN
jgi:hypothetical protein